MGGSYYSKGFDAAASFRCRHRSAIGTAQWVVFECMDLGDALEKMDSRLQSGTADFETDRMARIALAAMLDASVRVLRDGGALLCLNWDGERCPF